MCVGESLEERDDGKAFDKVRGQLQKGLEGIGAGDAVKIVIAYEPIWAHRHGQDGDTSAGGRDVCLYKEHAHRAVRRGHGPMR